MDGALADIQADDMKHGLYDSLLDENQRVELEEMIAQRLLDVVSQKDLENTYYDMQKEWTETLTDEQLIETAKDLNVGNHLLEIL